MRAKGRMIKMYKFASIQAHIKKLNIKGVKISVSQVDKDNEHNPYITVTLERGYEESVLWFTKTKGGILTELFINGLLCDYESSHNQHEAIKWAFKGL